ncbi:hypothetical protein ACIBIZ_09360 [Nonomuraea spiralis]|uniref:hypothetical protein n=1 Tax=Nonomuraea TaxID=83681 RepID=UPI00163BAE00|nr:hypothetical protein [Nonomuraea sp. WAC 01424]
MPPVESGETAPGHGPGAVAEQTYQMNHACRLIRRPVTRRSSFLMEITSLP